MCYYSIEGCLVQGYFIETSEKSFEVVLQKAKHKNNLLKDKVYELSISHFPESHLRTWNTIPTTPEGRNIYWRYINREKFVLSKTIQAKRGINIRLDSTYYYMEFQLAGRLK